MPTTHAPNPSNIRPFPNYAPNMCPTAMCTIAFRQSADGENFKITPVFLLAADAAAALRISPAEYAVPADEPKFAAWPKGLDTSGQRIGGRGRHQGACVATG